MHMLTTVEWIFVAGWITASIMNWIFINGYNNEYFKKHSKYNDSLPWIILVSIFTGFGGLATTLISGQYRHFGWRRLTQSQKNQIFMLRKLEETYTYQYNDDDDWLLK